MTPAVAQRTAALARANEIRVARAEERRRLKSLPYRESRRQAAELIVDPPELWRSATVGYVPAMPARTGPETVRLWLRQAGLPVTKRLGEMTDRQRRILAGVIR